MSNSPQVERWADGKSILTVLLTSALTLVGVWLTTEWRAQVETREAQVVEGYGRFLQGVARSTSSAGGSSELLAAKALLAVYGSPEMIARMAPIGDLGNDFEWERFLAAIEYMRVEIGAEPVDRLILHELLAPSSTSTSDIDITLDALGLLRQEIIEQLDAINRHLAELTVYAPSASQSDQPDQGGRPQ